MNGLHRRRSIGPAHTGGGQTYQVVLLPRTDHIPLDTLEALLTLAQKGGTVLIHDTLPGDVPGFHEYQKRVAQLQRLLETLNWKVFGGLRRAQIDTGNILLSEDLPILLKAASLSREPIVDQNVGFIRRTHTGGYHYLLANLDDRPLDGWVTFAKNMTSAALMDPMTGTGGIAATRNRNGESQVYLQLSPGDSVILRTFVDRTVEGPPWSYAEPAGTTFTIRGRWKVEFLAGGPVLPRSFNTSILQSWTERDGPELHRFAGTARYTIRFELPNVVDDD